MRAPSPVANFFKFRAVFGKKWPNNNFTHSPLVWRPHLGENPGSATARYSLQTTELDVCGVAHTHTHTHTHRASLTLQIYTCTQLSISLLTQPVIS